MNGIWVCMGCGARVPDELSEEELDKLEDGTMVHTVVVPSFDASGEFACFEREMCGPIVRVKGRARNMNAGGEG